ncbi:MAG: hypothetical protein JWL71_4995 [Acidobacteria bacterium]|nr:hypothetical protein [Acidobacteriota bacterium]
MSTTDHDLAGADILDAPATGANPMPARAPARAVPAPRTSGDPARPDAPTAGPDCAYSTPPDYFEDALEDAERLMKYAAEVGIDVEADIRTAILHARIESDSGWTDVGVARLLAALTQLAARVRPVTAESLKACSGETRHAVRGYWLWAVGLATIIVPFSLVSFVTSGISDAIRKDIATANELAVKLTTQVHPPAAPAGVAAAANSQSALPAGVSPVEVVTELQQFASLIRAIDGRALGLNRFILKSEIDPYHDIREQPPQLHAKFQLPDDLPHHLEAAVDGRITVFQDVRYFAQNVLNDISVFYGAVAACLLPALYALLGTCAYLLRSFEEQMRSRTFTPSVANSARFLIAGIGGAVVGLFNNFTVTQTASLPPLAIAFLVGYAVDVFFSFLEGVLQAFTKTKDPTVAVPAPAAVNGKV